MKNELAIDEPPTADLPMRWAPVMVAALAMLMVTLELSLSSVTLPAIGADLDVGSGATKWVILAYALPTAALAIPLGRWVDHADARKVFLYAVTGVAISSVLAAAAPTFWLLLIARVLQGILGAAVAAVYMPIVAASVPPERRGRALGYVATVMPLGAMAGTSIGGFIADGLGWRPVFLLKLPILAIVLWLGHRTLPHSENGLPRPSRALYADTLTLGGAVTALLLAFDRVEDDAFILAATLAVIAIALGAWWTRLPSSRPILTLSRRPEFGLPLLGLLLLASYIGLTLFLLPFYVSDVVDGSPAMMGLALMFFVGAFAAGSPLSGNLADRFPIRLVATAGAALSLTGTLLTLTLTSDANVLDLAWRLALIGLGQSLFNIPNNTAILAATPPDMIGAGSGVSMTVRTLAFTVGPSLAALAYTLGGSGAAGFRAGVILIAALQTAGLLAALAARTSEHDG
ncbi:MFS transporter [Spirillospora sp. NPDC048911]|uniref:MFS transporter n=1 Tax=Spirillospora sp. NPDC048911 TaxID=3364527 RepID=UPI003721C1A5